MVIEEVKMFKYLGYMLQRKGGRRKDVKKRLAKRAAMMGQRDSAREGYEKGGYGYLTH